MNRADRIKVKVFEDKILTRRVVKADGERVYICKQDEFMRAQKESQEPNRLGFMLTEVIERGGSPPRSQVTTRSGPEYSVYAGEKD